MTSRALVHFKRRSELLSRWSEADRAATQAREMIKNPHLPIEYIEPMQVDAMQAHLEAVAYRTASARYPDDPVRTMPTGLGNMLRKFEDKAGEPHGRDAIGATPQLMYTASPQQTAYVDDARTSLDLAVRFVISWTLIALASSLLLWSHSGWMVVPIGCYALAWFSYRAAIHAAEEYGEALVVLFDLNYGLPDQTRAEEGTSGESVSGGPDLAGGSRTPG